MKRNKFNRKVPVLRISLLSNADYGKICDVPEFKNMLMNETLVAIKEGIHKNKKSINLIEISDSKKYINIEKENWKEPLNTIMDYFSEREEFDKAIECRELLKKI